jgi:hypothetical protein
MVPKAFEVPRVSEFWRNQNFEGIFFSKFSKICKVSKIFNISKVSKVSKISKASRHSTMPVVRIFETLCPSG